MIWQMQCDVFIVANVTHKHDVGSQCHKSNVTKAIWQMQYDQVDVKNAMQWIQIDKCTMTNTIWLMPCCKYNVKRYYRRKTNCQKQCDNCNMTNDF